MNNELNLVEILKDCPKGMKLWSPCWGVLTYNGIDWREYDAWDYESNDVYPIQTTWVEEELLFNPYGQYIDSCDVMIYPSKDNRDWSTFRRPFNEGDFIYTECNSGNEWISIFKFRSEEGAHLTYADFNKNDESIYINNARGLCEDNDIKNQRLASDAEIEQLINALHTKGYNWNNEAKKIEKIEEDKPKWNPDTLQAFDKVLGIRAGGETWQGDMFIYRDSIYIGLGGKEYDKMIPYNEETKHLLGTNQEAPEYYRI